ncbi:PAT complex subunit CCDC47 isoform X2 [Arctopsyche grandis]|uniref:PAT complex subunit CCDC47 isoform X2 n=1 Tax=Arctopsyche grandis TaxID=121162 RepID=UPI00406D704C
MKFWLLVSQIFLVLGFLILSVSPSLDDASLLQDNEFAEFEQFDSEDDSQEIGVGSQPPPLYNIITVDESEDDILVEDEDNEFEHFQDPEEFEGFTEDAPNPAQEQPKITITKVPIMMRARWEAYWAEGLLVLGLVAYAATFLIGRSKNTSIVAAFTHFHKPLLDDNFTLVGEEVGEPGVWRKEAEHCYTMWCSGRTCCEGMLLTLKLIKRQDLVHLAIGLVRLTVDTLIIRVELGKDDMDAFVTCVAVKKTAIKLQKEMADLSVFCGEKRPGDKCGLPESFSVLSEIGEATQAIFDQRVCAAIEKFGHLIDYIHISDQYSGPKQTEETSSTKLPECQRVLLMGVTLPCVVAGIDKGCEAVAPVLTLLFYMMEKLKRFRLSKEAATKSERNRQKVEEAFLRSTHAARQQLAAQRREDKRRVEKDRILAEDPEKQRRWERKEQKRQLKKKTPKMKQLKVKAL